MEAIEQKYNICILTPSIEKQIVESGYNMFLVIFKEKIKDEEGTTKSDHIVKKEVDGIYVSNEGYLAIISKKKNKWDNFEAYPVLDEKFIGESCILPASLEKCYSSCRGGRWFKWNDRQFKKLKVDEIQKFLHNKVFLSWPDKTDKYKDLQCKTKKFRRFLKKSNDR